jgi:hypothetical protein
MSTKGIMVDPLKVEEIFQFPPTHTIPQLQSLQGKSNLLQHFVSNYVEITKVFMHLSKKGVPFYWDEVIGHSFEALKFSLTSATLLTPSDYGKDFFLYLVAIEPTVGMVLVQENDTLKDHVIYYLNRGLVGPKLNYTHVEKLTLEVVHVVQWFCHYILLRNTTVVAILNPFQYVLT